ncbi:hypothetical protein G7Y89_g2738 [Cudoniella acicularis]|uniref:Homeobox domain-containing protein n=1 Tax=Cudoniella acicularis TaxID=354080 RepID=A0A8H4RUJ8_9HELO|nr:hypothetical protein G7Y89_g2738 [Cudoniella acicularis]
MKAEEIWWRSIKPSGIPHYFLSSFIPQPLGYPLLGASQEGQSLLKLRYHKSRWNLNVRHSHRTCYDRTEILRPRSMLAAMHHTLFTAEIDNPYPPSLQVDKSVRKDSRGHQLDGDRSNNRESKRQVLNLVSAQSYFSTKSPQAKSEHRKTSCLLAELKKKARTVNPLRHSQILSQKFQVSRKAAKHSAIKRTLLPFPDHAQEIRVSRATKRATKILAYSVRRSLIGPTIGDVPDNAKLWYEGGRGLYNSPQRDTTAVPDFTGDGEEPKISSTPAINAGSDTSEDSSGSSTIRASSKTSKGDYEGSVCENESPPASLVNRFGDQEGDLSISQTNVLVRVAVDEAIKGSTAKLNFDSTFATSLCNKLGGHFAKMFDVRTVVAYEPLYFKVQNVALSFVSLFTNIIHQFKMSRITCLAVDQRTSRPAAGMRVVLRCSSPGHEVFSGFTNAGGEVEQWNNPTCTLEDFLNRTAETPEESWWQMGFFVGHFFGAKSTGYTVIDINFVKIRGENRHITLFAGPFEYRTWLRSDAKEPFVYPVFERRPRQRLSESQRITLMDNFTQKQYPDPAGYTSIAQSLNLPRLKVRQWFKVQRAQYRNKDRGRSEPWTQPEPVSPRLWINDPEQHDCRRATELVEENNIVAKSHQNSCHTAFEPNIDIEKIIDPIGQGPSAENCGSNASQFREATPPKIIEKFKSSFSDFSFESRPSTTSQIGGDASPKHISPLEGGDNLIGESREDTRVLKKRKIEVRRSTREKN